MASPHLECGSYWPNWYCLKVEPNREPNVSIRLALQGFETFIPRYIDYDGRDNPVRLMFPGYVFVLFDPDRDNWRPIGSTFGVTRLFSSTPESPTPIRDKRLTELLQLCGDDQIWDPFPKPPKRQRIYPIGHVLRINAGPLATQIGEHLRTKEGRVTLLLHLLGKSTEVVLDAKHVSAANG